MLLSVNVRRKGKEIPPLPTACIIHALPLSIDKKTKRGDWGRVASQPTPSPLYLPNERLPFFK